MREQLDNLTSKLKDVDPKQVSLDETIQELESLEQDTKNLNRKSNYSLENSEQLKNKSEQLKDTLEILLDDINTVEDIATMTIDDINVITMQLTKETGKEIDNALQEGQEYLNQIKGFDLSGREADADKTLEKVEDVLRNVTEYKLPVEELQEKVDEIKGNLLDIDDKLDDLFNHSQYSLNMAREAENIIAKSGKDRLKGKLSNIENQVKQSGINLDKSEELLSNASKLLDMSIGKLKELQDAPEILDGMNDKFEKELESNRKKIDEIQVLKPKVQEHAQSLSDRVQELEHILSESQYGSQDAVKAARAYKDIVAAVKSAREAADSAQNDSSNAAEILANVHERTNDAENNAATALEDAHDSATMVHQKLKPKLDQSVERYVPVKEAHKKNEDLLNEIEKMLKNIQIKDLNTAYKNASDTADAAADTISHVEPAVNNLFNKLSQETQQAKLLPKELNDMERNLKQTEKQLNTVNETLPSVIQSLEEIPKKQADNKRTSNNIQSNINKLNQQIELARDIANRIKVGVKFYPNTTLELRTPKNIEDLTTATKFSGYFKTSKPNGLLFYIGNPQGTTLPKTKTDDFMALIIQNGYPVLKMDLGNGVQKIINEKYVADDNWYQYIVERVGHNAKLTIREELPDRSVQNYVKETALSGPYTIFNLDKDKSKIFVGGYPSKYDAQLQDQVDMDSFQGEIEDVVIGNTPVSLWNFADGYENNHGAKERNKLVVLSPSTGFRFNGNGYAILEARSLSFRIKSAIELSFKTFTPTGLLFLAGKGNTFISIELQNGKVLYQYNLGGATKRWVSSSTYNDGQWHKIIAERDGARGRLQVDEENVTDRTKPITGSSLDIIDTMSFGGYPNMHKYGDVTNVRFDGCISNVTIMKTPIDLRANIQAYDVTPGCPDKFAPMVSFDQRQQGYISWDRISIQNRFNASLKFKTMDPEGLLFYVRDLNEDNGISLSLRDGHLVLISQQIELVSKDTFNDGQWHVVSVIHDDTILRLDTDDYGFKVTDHPPPPIHVLYSTLHVGGMPTQPVPLRVASSAPFRGCIADLTIMGRVMNFANTTDRSYAVLDKCILDHDVSVEVPVPTLKPVKPLQAVTTQSPVYVTVNPEEAAKAGRGDGGNDFLRTSTEEGARGVPPPSTIAPQVRGPVGTAPPTTQRPKLEGCALPLDPKRETNREVGYRLGTQRYSRLKFGTPRGKYKKRFDFRLEFKTRESDGIIFYAANRDHSHYAAVYLDDGKVVFTFKAEEPVIIKSRFIYNDDIWHIVEFNKDLANGKLVIDKEVAEGSSSNPAVLEFHPPFYMGGVDPDEYNLVQANLNTTSSFMGCIRSIQMNSFPFDPSETFGVIPCSENIELGTYFAGELSTYVKLKEKFKVGEVFNLKMDIKPRVISGVLAAAHGKKDYYVLELHNGHLQLTVENGKGPVTASFTADSPDHKYHLCDGQWHTIQAVKSKNVITLSVDSMFTSPKIGPAHSTSTDTGSALFLGGHRFIKKVRGIQSRMPYVGCVRNVTINDERVDLTTLPTTFINGNVDIGYCPTN
ncbi:unnamed protein product [Callosobruchus maculatus]|uniref:Laminin G domain-containing protein n=1 Tax=Callosobruchus maculatus TaxID=64391 RepID=A0A653CJ91_CALMS|nr:unnamed protein product [Callosobruchus maculatus]